MNGAQTYDYLIAGAGLAGLSLAWYLTREGAPGKRILIADKSLSPGNDKTWCFWSKSSIPDNSLIDHEWSRLEIRTPSHHETTGVAPYGYYCVNSDSYQRKMMEVLRTESSIDWVECDIHGLETDTDRDLAIMHTSAGIFEGEYLFQSIRPIDIDAHELNLKQHFIGWEIETDHELFDPDKACFMDLSVEQREGLTFMYILPYTEKRAIFEYTLFSEHLLKTAEYEEAITHYIESRHGLAKGDYRIVRKERGVIPMVDNGYRPGDGGRVLNIGASAGLAKASTGYTFTRTHSTNKQIAARLRQGLRPDPGNPSSFRFRAYDILLLHILKHDREAAHRVFEELFRKNKIERILKFLSEETSIFEEIRIFWSLPHRPFFRAIFGTRKLLIKSL
jgi:lycopene beta-cyclase